MMSEYGVYSSGETDGNDINSPAEYSPFEYIF
jgi:hypothetical protein